MSSVLDDLVRKFRAMDDESQQNVIRKVEKRDEEAAGILRKVYRMQKRGERMEEVTDSIVDRFS
jgi:predicted transcriptional regulator